MRTREGDAATELVLQTFRAHGRLLAAGGRLAGAEGLTAARWQVLGAIALAGRPLSVPQIARRMGLTRQAVQETVGRLSAEKLVVAEENPDHRRSPLIGLTESGRGRYDAVDRRQVEWINAVAGGLDVAELLIAARVLDQLGDRLKANAREGGEEG